jgi:acyl dehydratase
MAHGTLVLAVAVGQLAGNINEAAMSYGYDGIRFIKPVFINDTIRSAAEIVGLRAHTKRPNEFGFVDEKQSVTNQHGETVLALTHVYLVNRRPDS